MNNGALVTGAARRIGRALALTLAREGYSVAVHYHKSAEAAAEVVDEIRRAGGKAEKVAGDLQHHQMPAKIVAEAGVLVGKLSCLVNNASCFEPDAVGGISADSWDVHLDTNLRAPVFLAQAFAAQLPPGTAGNIVNIIDQRVLKPNPLFFSYTTSKAALWSATRTLAQALAPRIRVNAIGPGPALPTRRMARDDFDRQSRLTLLGRGTSPEEIAAALRYILSAPAVTGQMIVLDGGQHLVWQTPDVIGVNE
jgi:NAD(P)-dependent dehydrogenase (short-subunit alcohol dehydrogenase family)